MENRWISKFFWVKIRPKLRLNTKYAFIHGDEVFCLPEPYWPASYNMSYPLGKLCTDFPKFLVFVNIINLSPNAWVRALRRLFWIVHVVLTNVISLPLDRDDFGNNFPHLGKDCVPSRVFGSIFSSEKGVECNPRFLA